MKTSTFVFIVLLVLTAFGIVVMAALMADVDTAGAQEPAPECWHGCPPRRTAQIWLPIVSQYLPTWWDGDNSGDASEVTK